MPAPSYITRDTLKLALKRKPTDTSVDELLDIAVDGSARAIYRKTGKRRFDKDAAPTTRLIATRGRVVYDRSWCEFRLMVPDIASSVGLVVANEGGSPIHPAIPILPDDPTSEPITDLRLPSWPERIQLTAQFGWPEIPGDIVQAQLLQAMRYYRRKDSPEGIAGSAEWGLVRVPRLDPDVAEMIEDYCLPAVA